MFALIVWKEGSILTDDSGSWLRDRLDKAKTGRPVRIPIVLVHTDLPELIDGTWLLGVT